jgi:hypothetical protein
LKIEGGVGDRRMHLPVQTQHLQTESMRRKEGVEEARDWLRYWLTANTDKLSIL